MSTTPSASPASLRGKFLSFEGIDGCGKSTQAAALAERLERSGFSVVRTREPGGTKAGQALRNLLLAPEYRGLAPDTELLLFLADRIQHLAEVIRPAIARGAVVVCDRFHDATVAFQQHARGLDFSAIQPWIDTHIRPQPDLTFWLDVDLAVALARLRQREGSAHGTAGYEALTRLDREPAEFHRRVRQGYQTLSEREPSRIVRIDGLPSTESVHEAIWTAVCQRFLL
ncbi:MAG: dTMP kinase [SAR324 cluster bacterium]